MEIKLTNRIRKVNKKIVFLTILSLFIVLLSGQDFVILASSFFPLTENETPVNFVNLFLEEKNNINIFFTSTMRQFRLYFYSK